MTTITASVIKDSVSENNIRLTTMQLRYPRFIHSEFMTHRVFSRNASSSRAIPFKRMLQDIRSDPVIPLHWGKNQPGMQANEEVDDRTKANLERVWRSTLFMVAEQAEILSNYGLHKQVVNRILEPWAHINVLVTSTKWQNFFNLRNHPDAQPEIQHLAKAMINAMNNSKPTFLYRDDWHLPYVDDEEGSTFTRIKCSVARSARVSYMTHEMKQPTIEEDVTLYDRLVKSKPPHLSPTEHQARPDVKALNDKWMNPHTHGNFDGWIQYRQLLNLR